MEKGNKTIQITAVNVTGNVGSQFLSSAKREFRAKTLPQEEVYLMCKVQLYLKRRFEWVPQRAALVF